MIGNESEVSSPGGDNVKPTEAESAVSALLKDKIDPSCYKYEGDKCFFVDPGSGAEFEWNGTKKEWNPRQEKRNPSASDYKYDGETYYYTDDKANITYKWDRENSMWVTKKLASGEGLDALLKGNVSDGEEFDEGVSKPEIKRQDMSQGVYGFDGDSHTYTDSKDGTVYLWDKDKSAWFPKVDDDFLAQYQMNYGFSSADSKGSSQETIKVPPKEEMAANTSTESLKRKQEPTWFNIDDKSNTKVYVSNLPLDYTEKEFVDLMQKCGLIMKELDSDRFKIKMYTDPETESFKGDALCTYIKVESVNLALNILDGYLVNGKKIKVERAKFQMKGSSYDPNLKPKKKSKKQLEKLRKKQEKLFDWRPDKLRGERGRNERVVVIKNLFEPSLFDDDVGLIVEFRQDLRDEASKCGDVKKVVLFDRHQEGVAQIIFKEAEAADACVQLLNNRWFGKRQITAETWDGKTKYTVEETEQQKAERLKKWEKFIEQDEKSKKDQLMKAEESDDTRSSAGSDDTDDERESSTKSDKQSDENKSVDNS